MATTGFRNPDLPKPLAGLTFVLFWAVAIVAWCLVGLSSDHATRGFIADIGIVFASVGFAAPFLATKVNFYRALMLGIVGIALFAVVGYANITVLIYFLRLLIPFLALMTPVNLFSSRVKIWS